MIIETSDNKFYRVVETGQPGLEHVWYGVRVKRVHRYFALTSAGKRAYANGRPELVRKAATRIVEE
jgi:hypothetical protein